MLTVLEFSIIKVLGKKEKSGETIRHEAVWCSTLASFYQLMQRMQNQELIASKWVRNEDGIRIKCYKATKKGLNSFEATRKFYQ